MLRPHIGRLARLVVLNIGHLLPTVRNYFGRAAAATTIKICQPDIRMGKSNPRTNHAEGLMIANEFRGLDAYLEESQATAWAI